MVFSGQVKHGYFFILCQIFDTLSHLMTWGIGKKMKKILFNNLPKPFLLYNSGAEHLFHSRVYYSQLSLLLIWDKKNGQAIQAGE